MMAPATADAVRRREFVWRIIALVASVVALAMVTYVVVGERPLGVEAAGEAGDVAGQLLARPANPYLEFGSRIQVYPKTGLIMKPFHFPAGVAEKILDLIRLHGDLPIYRALGDGVVQGRPGEDEASGEDEQRPGSVVLNLLPDDVLLVTASPAVLRQVEAKIACWTLPQR